MNSPLTNLHDWLVEAKLIEDSHDDNLQIVRMWTLVEAEGIALCLNENPAEFGGARWLAGYSTNLTPVSGPTMLIAALRAVWRKRDVRP